MTTADLSAILADLQALVGCESPSADLAAVQRSADLVAQLGTVRLGVAPERVVVEGCSHLRWRFGTGPRRVLVLAHHDTVWPIGSLETHPWTNSAGMVTGPGCFDMKSGLVMAWHALAALAALASAGPPAAGDGGSALAGDAGSAPAGDAGSAAAGDGGSALDGVTLLVTGDEEVGSTTSRKLIEDEARGCQAVFVLEASGPGGALKTSRKGVSRYQLQVTGRAAHAGLEPEKGINAGIELAHQVLAIAALAGAAHTDDTAGTAGAGTTVTPTASVAGTAANTVPASAVLDIDCRVWTVAEQDRLHRELTALQPVLPGSRILMTGGPNRPPMESAAVQPLFALAQEIASSLGLAELSQMAVGGASDGNFTAGIGVPTLDGLGAVGGGAHADDEHVLVSELVPRTALLAGLIQRVLAGN